MAKQVKTAPEPLKRSPSHLLHLALQYALDVYAKEVGSADITQRQYAVLCAVANNDGASQIDLVRSTGIDRSTLAQLVGRMIGKGLLARERSQTDNRVNAVHLTEAGQAALAETSARAEEADARIMRVIGRSRRDSFLAALRDLSKAGRTGGDESEDEASDEAKPAKKKKAKSGAKKDAKKARKAKAPADPVAADS